MARSPQRSQFADNDNKLVVGAAGSGRSLMLGRLARTAHEAGNCVVVINNYGTNPNNPGALWTLPQRLGGTFHALSTPETLRFNPFWLPGAGGAAWRLPTIEELSSLAVVLVNVLQLTRYGVPEAETRLNTEMYNALASYYTSEQAARSPYPCFADFARALNGHERGQDEVSSGFLGWFAHASQPFVAGGPLESLLSATRYEVEGLVHCAGNDRFLHVEVALDSRCATDADTPGFSRRGWPHPAPEAQTRALLLLLHTLDTHLGQRSNRRLTVVADELHYDALGERMATFLATYLSQAGHYNRELVAGHADASRIREEYAPLGLSEEEVAALAARSPARREVLIRRPDEDYAVLSARLGRADLTDFLPKRFLQLLDPS